MKEKHSSDGAEREENFAEMFDKAYKEPSRLEPGQKIESTIVKITAEWALIEVGGKGEGYLDKKELMNDKGELTAKEGDKIRAYFLYSEEGEMRFTTRIGSGPAARAQLEDAWRNGIAVEATLVREMKGGFEATINGGARAFCPFSHMGMRREENKENYIGRSFTFDIIECGDRNVVLSRKNILEKERQERKKSLKASLSEGDKLKGRVTSIRDFGAFVDIGGVEGLLPVSEISWNRTEKVSDVLSSGQTVEVIIKKLDWDNDRISFSLKDALPNPWDAAEQNWPTGSYHTGKVSRIAPFGAFVTLGEGVDGLIHSSRLNGDKETGRAAQTLEAGQTIEVRVESVDTANKRISLVPAEVSREEEADAVVLKNYRDADPAEMRSMGTMGEMLKKQLEKKAGGDKK